MNDLFTQTRDSIFKTWMKTEDLQARADPNREQELYRFLNEANWNLFKAWMQFKEVRG